MNKLNYNYIILGSGLGEYYNYAYRQVNELEGNLFEGSFPWSRFIELANRVHFSNRLNRYINLPLKRVWVYAYLKYIQKKVKPLAKQESKICFVFFRTWFIKGLLEYNFATLLRKRYPNCKIVFYIQDQVSVSGIPIELLKKNADLMIYYDQKDALNFDGIYHDVPYSTIDEFKVSSDKICSDVYFVGYAKNRYEDIIKVFEKLTSKGLKCDFNIMGVPKEKRIYEEQINYDRVLKYKENLEKVGRTRCILEIIQRGSEGNTLRTYEAIMLDKLLLSNNMALKKNDLYEKEYMQIYTDVQDIDIDMIKNQQDVYYRNKERLYPENFIYFIERNLTEDIF